MGEGYPRILVGDDYVWFGTQMGLYRVPKTGGEVEGIAAGDLVRNLSFYEGYVHFTECWSGRQGRAPVDGGLAELLREGVPRPLGQVHRCRLGRHSPLRRGRQAPLEAPHASVKRCPLPKTLRAALPMAGVRRLSDQKVRRDLTTGSGQQDFPPLIERCGASEAEDKELGLGVFGAGGDDCHGADEDGSAFSGLVGPKAKRFFGPEL